MGGSHVPMSSAGAGSSTDDITPVPTAAAADVAIDIADRPAPPQIVTRKKSIEEEVDEEIEKEIEAEVDAEFKLVSKVLDDATAHRARGKGGGLRVVKR